MVYTRDRNYVDAMRGSHTDEKESGVHTHEHERADTSMYHIIRIVQFFLFDNQDSGIESPLWDLYR